MSKIDISLVLPTLNEEENLKILLPNIHLILKEYNYEIIVVDDNSSDHTRLVAENFFKDYIRGFVHHRIESLGLSSAIYDGFNLASGKILVVMDADLQHDEKILPKIINPISSGDADICIASRNIEQGGYGDLSRVRKTLSKIGIWAANFFLNMRLSDPMSGFFSVSRSQFNDLKSNINPRGFKLLLEMLYKSNNAVVMHVPYQFKSRLHGKTKLTPSIGFEYLLALLDLKLGWVISYRFLQFSFVGFIGSCLNFLFFLIFLALQVPLLYSAFYAASLGMIWSFLANNFFTFSESRYTRKKIIFGGAIYLFFSLPGILVQVSVTSFIIGLLGEVVFLNVHYYFIYILAVISGAVLNYFIHLNITWKRIGQSILPPSIRK
jgi:dolichol-phosphate mannosyltransferase